MKSITGVLSGEELGALLQIATGAGQAPISATLAKRLLAHGLVRTSEGGFKLTAEGRLRVAIGK